LIDLQWKISKALYSVSILLEFFELVLNDFISEYIRTFTVPIPQCLSEVKEKMQKEKLEFLTKILSHNDLEAFEVVLLLPILFH
jgi:hypothetical protein